MYTKIQCASNTCTIYSMCCTVHCIVHTMTFTYLFHNLLLFPQVSCFLGTRPPPLPRWQRILYPFQLSTWVAFLVGLLLSGPVLCFLARAWDVRLAVMLS